LLAAVLGATACNNALQGFAPNSSGAPTPQSKPDRGRISIGSNIPGATEGKSYGVVLSVQGGTAPYQFSLRSGSLPAGLTLNATTGSISGTPAKAGEFNFTIEVTDSPRTARGWREFTLAVAAAPNAPKVQVEITPATSSLASASKLQFTAATRNTSNPAVQWSASAGTISNTGLFTAPTVSSNRSVTVTATSVADPAAKASAAVTVTASVPPPSPKLTITTSSAPEATSGAGYKLSLKASGGQAPYAWSIVSGSLPGGLFLDSGSGLLAGTAGADGTYRFTVQVTDAAKTQASQALSITVASSVSGSDFDGPAELPREYIKSGMSDTPAPGGTIHVSAGSDLQAALDRAACGDTIELQAGATFTGSFVLPAKACDNDHWIIVRTSAPDSSLPPEGTRVTPCYAGLGSLPNRPSFNCSSPAKVLATIVFPQGTGSGPLFLADGANHYRLLGLEITRANGTGNLTHLLSIRKSGSASHIVIDRVWMHGTAHDETKSGVHLSGITYAAVVDSYFTDFHCISMSGSCTDAQAVNGGTGDLAGGPYKIVNNFLEASTEAILMGGGAATKTPADIEIRRNHFFKPLQWMKGVPGFVGAANNNPFTVKNHLELKNAQRVLIEGNIMENTWGGFSQAGFSILLTPKNQHQGTTNVCPLCQVTDVTIRYNTLSHAGGGMQIANGISGDGTNGDKALAGARYSIHDITIDDIRADYFTGNGTLFQIANGWDTNVLNSVSISHITGFPDAKGHLLSIGNKTSHPPMWGFTFTNNLVIAGAYPVWSTGGGDTNCAHANVPSTNIPACFTSYSFSNNGIIGTTSAFPASRWPAGNYFPADAAGLFVNYSGGDYHLASSNPMRSAATTDSKTIGADIDAIQAATEGVY
jgi:hypothetical protein